MAFQHNDGTLGSLFDTLKSGEITRREFIQRATGTGIGAAMAIFLANSATVAAAGGSQNGFAVYPGQDGTPSAAPDLGGAVALDSGTEGQTRGEGGELRLLQWQAATILSPHNATGTKDYLAGSLIVEPLMNFLPDGTIIPRLISEVPAVENGLLAEDLSSVTFNLLPDVVWSDGEPFTANDVRFTWEWITNSDRPTNLSVTLQVWEVVSDLEVVDDHTCIAHFDTPSAAWFEPFTGTVNGPIYPAHMFDNDPLNPNDEFMNAPIGTGPYVLESFVPGDLVTYVANENYREANKPFFNTVTLKGGGDPVTAARAVIQTGEYDYAWNIQVEPAVKQDIVDNGDNGIIINELGSSLERIHINFSDPRTEVDGQRSDMNTPHPFLTDDAVRQAMNLAVPRDVIADEFYGDGQPATANVLNGVDSFVSTSTSWTFDLEQATQILDDAGWVMNGNVRERDGVQLEVTYATSVNLVRQKTQAVVKQAFESIGIATQLVEIDQSIFFDGGAGNEQNINHFYWDIDMYTSNPSSPIPTSFMVQWYAGADGSNVAQQSNGWQGQNFSRWVNEDYDALYEQLLTETTIEDASATLIAMNDLVVENVAAIPQVNRAADSYAIANKLNHENAVRGVFEYSYWNIANWNLAEGYEAE